MITEDYCSQEVVKLLMAKGFDVKVGGMYVDKDNNFVHANIAPLKVKDYEKVWDDQFIPTCTHQMAMKWLRKIYGFHISVAPYLNNEGEVTWVWEIINIETTTIIADSLDNNDFDSCEQAVEAALKYTLENLI